MGRKKVVSEVDAALMAQAHADLKRIPEGKVAVRLVAIIALGRGQTLQEVAACLGVVRQRPAEWVRWYKAHGAKGLEDRPKGHRRARLTEEQEAQAQDWISRGVDPQGQPIHWTIEALRAALEETMGVRYGNTRVWELLRKWG